MLYFYCLEKLLYFYWRHSVVLTVFTRYNFYGFSINRAIVFVRASANKITFSILDSCTNHVVTFKYVWLKCRSAMVNPQLKTSADKPLISARQVNVYIRSWINDGHRLNFQTVYWFLENTTSVAAERHYRQIVLSP